MRSAVTTLLVCAVAVATVLTSACQRQPPSAGGPLDRSVTLGGKLVSAEQLRRGAAAYSHYCRACHGEGGHGDGLSARGLNPPPRDLRLGVYKFAAVATGQLPNDEDFRRIITGGLHGTAMLAWDIPAVELDALIQFIKALSPRWQTETPGDPIVMTKDPWTGRDAAAIDRGKRVYHGMAQCAVACHPAYATRQEIFDFTHELSQMRLEEFRADLYEGVPKPSDYGVMILPPDFTFQPLRAGETVPDIARSIASGIGGTAMPTWKNVLPDSDLWAMAYYVRSLVVLRDTAGAGELRAGLVGQAAWVVPAAPDAGFDATPDASVRR